MAKTTNSLVVPDEVVINKIYYIRGQKVMLDKDLAELYGVETKRLKEQVKRNVNRFPKDFMFELTKEESISLRSQNATLKRGGFSKYLPIAFTEHGVLMLSSVLSSEKAIQVNIQIMRIYTRLREMLMTHKDLLLKMEEVEHRLNSNDEQIQSIFDCLKQLITQEEQPRREMGYRRQHK